MQYGINIDFYAKTLGMPTAAKLVAEAGFTHLDYTPPVAQEDWQQTMQAHLGIFADFGLTVHQTHAPFNRYNHHGDQHLLRLQRVAEATEAMGAKFMVVHGDEFNFAEREFDPEAALQYNHDLFLPYVESGGYRVAFETVFEDLKRRRFTSQAEELLALIQSYGSEYAVCCWDVGHGHVSFKRNAPEIIRHFGSLIQCTHVHDNAGNDSHQMPMTGDVDWHATVDAFKATGYSGIWSIEYAHGSLPEDMIPQYLRMTRLAAQKTWESV